MENQKFYTGVGDKGYTRTISNFRIAKSDAVIELLGTLDEFTSSLGLAKTYLRDATLIEDIELVQRRLIDICGEVAGGKITVTQNCVSAVEAMIDRYQQSVGEFDGFIIPGGSKASAHLDVARTVMRRAERVATKAGQFNRLSSVLLVYFNRLCDLIYCFARYQDKIDNNQLKPTLKSDAKSENIDIAELTLSVAKKIAVAVEQRAKAMEKNVVVAIVDKGANIMLLHSMDDAYIASAQIAQDKAYTSVSLKMPTHIALELSRGGALDGLMPTSQNKLSLLGGGYPLKIGDKIVGAIGVSGGTADEDIGFAEYAASYLNEIGTA